MPALAYKSLARLYRGAILGEIDWLLMSSLGIMEITNNVDVRNDGNDDTLSTYFCNKVKVEDDVGIHQVC